MANTSNTNASVNCLDCVEQNIKFFDNLPVQDVGKLKLKRSIIPKEKRVIVSFHLDLDTAYLFNGLASSLGLTTDELCRQIAWNITDSK